MEFTSVFFHHKRPTVFSHTFRCQAVAPGSFRSKSSRGSSIMEDFGGIPSKNVQVYLWSIYPIPSMYGIFTYIYHILPLKTSKCR